MLSIETTQTWTGATVTVETSDTNSTAYVLAGEVSAYDAIEAIVATLEADLFGTWSWSWARDPASGGALLSVHLDDPLLTFRLQANAAAQSLLGLPADSGAGQTTVTASSAAAGTWAPVSRISVRGNFRAVDRGDGSGNGAIRPGAPGVGHRRPLVEAVGTATDAGRLSAILALASNPRRVTVYQVHTATWLALALGRVDRRAAGATQYRFGLEVVGDTL